MSSLLGPPKSASGNEVAPDGYIYVCCACGKVSPDMFGMPEIVGPIPRSRFWDESCMLNCTLVAVDKIVWSPGKRVIEVKP